MAHVARMLYVIVYHADGPDQRAQCTVAELCAFVVDSRQELSYRKQIARQLRTQDVKGICDPVTLKSRFRVTRAHWKRNHWADHT